MKDFFAGYIVLVQLLIHKGTSQLGDICQNQNFVAECNNDEVILMTSARYGRLSKYSPCVNRTFGFIGCQTDVLKEADSMCSGRRKCQIHIPNPKFDGIGDCPSDLKSYLQPKYRCMKVHHSPLQSCPSSDHVVVKALRGQQGHLASVWTQETRLGSVACPYVIEAPPGTVIKFTLYDFSLDQPIRERVYANIKDSTPYSAYDVRANAHRESHVYTSVSSWVQVRMIVRRSSNFHFILKFEVTGCPDPITNLNTWSRRENTVVTLGCKSSDEKWTLTCQDNKWKGKVENCSLAGVRQIIGEDENKPPLSHKMSLILIITIALALGSIILAIGILILKWKRGHPSLYGMYHQQQQQPHQHDLKLSETVPRDPYMDSNLPPPSPKDYGYGKENEYAYISDFPPPTYDVNTKRTTIEERQMELYQARQCVGPYGTYAHGLEDPKAPNKVTTPVVQQRKSAPVAPVPGFPPAYYELDTGRQMEGGKVRGGTSGGSFKHNTPGIVPEVPCTPSAYDHLINTGCMSNHKSV